MKKVKLTIEGMHCASCATNVEKSLKTLPSVKGVTVSVLTKKAFVEAEDAAKNDELKKAVEKVGYKVSAIS